MKSKKINVDPFINQDGNYKRLANSFFYDKITFSNYKHKDSGELKTIYTTIPSDDDLENHLKIINSCDPSLLIKMLSLISKFPKGFFTKKTNILYLEDNLSDDIIENIIKWCIINGFPFNVDNAYKKRTNKLFVIPEPGNEVSFRLCDFIYHLNDIGSAYHLYRIITDYTDNENLPIFTSYLNNRESADWDFIDITKLSKLECKELFEKKYQNIKYENRIFIGNEIRFDVKANSLFDAVYYQLAMMLYDTGKELKVCPICHEYFEPNHGNQIYCNRTTCYSQKAYKQKKLAEKKKSNSTK